MKAITFFYIVLILGINSCAIKNIKPLRYDGIYRQYSGADIMYIKFKKDKHEIYSVMYDHVNDKKAIKELTNKTKKQKYFYRNKKDKVSTYWNNRSGSYDGVIYKNKNGEIKDSFFIKTLNGKIKKIIDLRIINKYKIYSADLELLSNINFESVKPINSKYVIVKKNNKYGIFDIKNKKIIGKINYQWVYLSKYKNHISAFKYNGKYGFVDENFNIIIKAQYDKIKSIQYGEYFVDGVQVVKVKSKWVIIDIENNKVIDDEFDKVGEHISKEFVPVYQKSKGYYHFVNLKTKKYTDVKAYSNSVISGYNIAVVGKNKEMIFDKTGNKIFDFVFNSVHPRISSDNKVYFIIFDNSLGKFGVIDKNKNLIVPFKFYNIEEFKNKDGKIIYFKVFSKRKKYEGLYDTMGNSILPLEFQDINIFNKEKKYFLTVTDGKIHSFSPFRYHIYGDKSRKPLFLSKYIHKVHKNDKYAIFTGKNGLEGIIDKNLNIVIKPKYGNILDLKKELYIVYSGGDSSIYRIGREDELLEIDGRASFSDNYIIGGNRSIFNYSFNKLNKKSLRMIRTCYKSPNLLIIKTKNNKWGVVNGNIISYFKEKYEDISCDVGNLIIVKRNIDKAKK